MCHIDCEDCASKRESITMEINRRLAIQSSLESAQDRALEHHIVYSDAGPDVPDLFEER